jgi:hypothetical protein
MTNLYVPYDGEIPAAIEINGHRLVIVSTSRDELEDDLQRIGGTEIREIEVPEDENRMLVDIASAVHGGVVIPPPGMTVESVIENLERELPWMQ